MAINAKDIAYEEDILRDPHSLKNWWYYLDFKADAAQEVRNLIYERALRILPRSYKLWLKYLNERMNAVKDLCVTDVAYQKVNNCFERSLAHMHKFPRIWKEYLTFMMKQKLLNATRHAFDSALGALPITQHLQWIWPLYLTFAQESNVPETACRVFRRYLKVESNDKEEFIKYLKKAAKLDQAALVLAEIVNDEDYVSTHGKSRHDLWTELLTLIVKNPSKIKSMDVEAVIRGGIRRFSHEVGNLWTSLADYYIRMGHFEKARDIYEEGINTVSTVRDFSLIFDAYSQYEESMLAAKMEAAEQDDDGDAEDLEAAETEIDLRMFRLEQLMRRQPLLLSSVLLRQNPHNVKEWQKRINLFCEGELADPGKAIMTYTDAVTTVDPQKATGKPHALWVSFARFYEKHGDMDNTRVIFEKGANINYKTVEDLANLWCEYAEFELRHKKIVRARDVLAKACVVPKKEVRAFKKGGVDRMPVQQRLYKSTKLWSFYADLEEVVGDLQSVKTVYETIVDIKVATPALILAYAQIMEEHKYFEDSFRVYEKGIALFKHPHVHPIWIAYLRKFITRYKGTKIERVRDLFEQAVDGCEAKESLHLYLLYAKFEEEHGLLKRAMDVYNRACEACAPEDKQKTYFIYVSRCGEFFGVTKTREIYEQAIQKLGDKDLKPVCMRYAALEKRLGEVDRARAVYVYGAQFCDPRNHADYWTTWHEFEVHHGNQDTFKEMLRVKRTVTAQYSQANLMTANVSAATSAAKPKDDMAALEQEAAEEAQRNSAAEQAKNLEAQQATAQAAAAEANPEEIDLDADSDEDSDEAPAAKKGSGDIQDVEEQKVPDAVFMAASSTNEKMGARERFKRKQPEQSVE